MPHIFHHSREMQTLAQQLRGMGKRIGLIPTMGALHEGHLSLVRRAKQECDVAIATIFVNPTQFGPREDFSKYPRTLTEDRVLLRDAGCDYVFAPSAEEMYPPGFSTYVSPPDVAKPLEGTFRPDHFRGVCTVVLKLFEIVPSDVAYFGRKDFQQALVVGRMIADLNLPVRLEVCPIVREPDGLAMSSRNRYLSAEQREQALALRRALDAADRLIASGEHQAYVVRESMVAVLKQSGIDRIDYATLCDAETLDELDQVSRPAVALIACHVGTTRLIDNEVWR